jgi:predicted TIM-barrel fold metal-dependent hydrolase
MFGADRFMVNSDFPHHVGGAGEGMVDTVLSIDGLSPDQREKLLGSSACELFAIDPVTHQQHRTTATRPGAL